YDQPGPSGRLARGRASWGSTGGESGSAMCDRTVAGSARTSLKTLDGRPMTPSASMVALLDTAGRVDLELERFESIPAGDRYSLLRVDGRWVLAPGVDAPEPTLVVQRGARRDRFAPLPGAGDDWRLDDGRAWSAGYAVPLDLILDARVRFWLEAAGPRYPLPSPVERPLLDGHRAEVVIRNGRPHLLLACGLMAVALAPLVHPAAAGAPVAGDQAPATRRPRPSRSPRRRASTQRRTSPRSPAPCWRASRSRRSCCRSTRRPPPSTTCRGRSWPRSTRSRPTTAATSTSPPRAPRAGCSSCPRRGARTAWTPTSTASATRPTRPTRSSPRRATCTRPGRRRASGARSSPTTTPTGTSTWSSARRVHSSACRRAPSPRSPAWRS